MALVDWRKNHWVHRWFCEHDSNANECREIELAADTLSKFCDKLEAWIEDPESTDRAGEAQLVLESQTDDPEYEDCPVTPAMRADAKDEAKTIRKAIAWLRSPCDKKGRTGSTATRRTRRAAGSRLVK